MAWFDWGHAYLLMAVWCAADFSMVPTTVKLAPWKNVAASAFMGLIWPIALGWAIGFSAWEMWWERRK